MAAVVLDTRPLIPSLRERLKADVSTFTRRFNVTPKLVIISVGENTAVYNYVRLVSRNITVVGMKSQVHFLSANTQETELQEHLEELNHNSAINAISLQLPLPNHLNIIRAGSYVLPEKDVEGLHPLNVGFINLGEIKFLPPPALGMLELMHQFRIVPAGKNVVIVSRSPIIGKPLANMLALADATVTVCHSKTPALVEQTRRADILISATHQPNFIKAEMVKPGATVIDFGINYSGGKLIGDVDFESVRQVAGSLTPVPFGTGPLTVMALLQNVFRAVVAQYQHRMDYEG